MATITSKPKSSAAKFSFKRADAKQALLSAGKKVVVTPSTQFSAMEVEKLRAKIAEMEVEFAAFKAAIEAPKVILPELHDRHSGRIDAVKVAEFMGVALKPLAEGLGLNYKAVHRSPSAAGFQEALRPVKRTLELLHEFFGPPEAIRIWLNTPHPDLGGSTALDTILAGRAQAVAVILENARNGVPV